MKTGYVKMSFCVFLTLPSLVDCLSKERSNIILILADDMGYSDIGCYGGEIFTPNIDKLALEGVRMTQFYNNGRSCPSRASLMTGLYPHQTGIGAMSEVRFNPNEKNHDWKIPGYRGFLNKNCVTIAEVLKSCGYHTYMSGKWHLGMTTIDKWPLQRGFEKYYGILAGATSYLRPSGDRCLIEDNSRITPPDSIYYTTDAFTDYAIKCINGQNDNRPFFLYLSYNAPHWPLHAKVKDIDKFYNIYREKGWDIIRKERYDRMVALGIIEDNLGFAEWENRSWNELSEEEKDKTAYRMAVYAAQVHSMDYNIGKLIDYLKVNGKYDNTVIIFLSDNGACAEPMNELGGGKQSDINNPNVCGQPAYGRAWAQVSNTPFRKYKQKVYEGGISTPFIISWQKEFSEFSGKWCTIPSLLTDIMPTILHIAEAEYPEKYEDNYITPLDGVSIIPVLKGEKDYLHEYMFWEHQGNRAVRWKNWKAVWDYKVKKWELYDIVNDRIETSDLSDENTDILNQMINKWNLWANKVNVLVPYGKPINKKRK